MTFSSARYELTPVDGLKIEDLCPRNACDDYESYARLVISIARLVGGDKAELMLYALEHRTNPRDYSSKDLNPVLQKLLQLPIKGGVFTLQVQSGVDATSLQIRNTADLSNPKRLALQDMYETHIPDKHFVISPLIAALWKGKSQGSLGYVLLYNNRYWLTDPDDDATTFFATSLLRHLEETPATQSKPNEFPLGLQNAFLKHYRHANDVMLRHWLPWLREHRSDFEHLIDVPNKYKFAYRLLTNVSEKDLRGFARVAPKVKGIVKGGRYRANKGKLLSSWTVDVRVLMDEDLQDSIGFKETEPGHYTLLLECDLASQRDKFIGNPDTLPNYLKTGNYGKEREVIGIGSIPLKRVLYQRNTTEDLLYKDITRVVHRHPHAKGIFT